MYKSIYVLLLSLLTTGVFAQKQAPANWFNLDKKKNKVSGVSADKAYLDFLNGRKPAKKVIVAVIDSGTDPDHEDLRDVIWTNSKEVAGNGIDDDGNGYVDDVHGWNFIGGKNGDVNEDNLEMTRVYTKWKPVFDKADTNKLSSNEKHRYYTFKKAQMQYENEKEQFGKLNEYMGNLLKDIDKVLKKIGKDEPTAEDLKGYSTTNGREMIAIKTMEKTIKAKGSIADLKKAIGEAHEYYDKKVNIHLNASLNSRKIVGDNYDDATEKHYGNNHVLGPNGEHGTHVAGIIAAIRDNSKGINGVCNSLEVMVVRVVPDGDERDKDVANGIRYAVDNGASVINMSFGKSFSYNKKVVDDAVKYAVSKDVVIVHASGNDAQNNDIETNYPQPTYENSTEKAATWIEVGASSWKKKKESVADFSNYGKNSVDVLAPGVDIYSCLPNSTYGTYSGTSMAAPVTAGVAALVRAYYPSLTAVQIKEVIMESAIKIKGKVYVPNKENKNKVKVKAKELCRTGAIVNAYEAMKLADKMASRTSVSR